MILQWINDTSTPRHQLHHLVNHSIIVTFDERHEYDSNVRPVIRADGLLQSIQSTCTTSLL